MDTQVLRAMACPANPFSGKQAPDHRPLGFTTQDSLEGELKYNPFAKSYPRFKPSNVLKPLPEFAFGVNPTFSRQEGPVEEFLRQNISMPDVYTTGRVYSADLVEMYGKIEAQHRDVPGALSADYQGSPWMYGALYGLPIAHPTNSSNFIAEYGEALSDNEWHRRTQNLIDKGYEVEDVKRAMKDHLNDQLKQKLAKK